MPTQVVDKQSLQTAQSMACLLLDASPPDINGFVTNILLPPYRHQALERQTCLSSHPASANGNQYCMKG
eukprot:6373305-Amphidinium_carterae.1